ncbi:MAG: hypothetical protein WBZ01_20175 [Terriglobales bacterium]
MATQIQAAIPAGTLDGTATIQVTDPVTGSFSDMTGALTYGATATDLLLLLQGAEPSTPVGSAAANPIRVRAVAADGVTPVYGATAAWSATSGVQFSVCNGASSCSVLTDEAGESSSSVTPTATGPSTITIALAPASYSPPQSQQATLVGTSTTLDLAAVAPTRWVGQGATIAVPLTVEALDLGVPQANVAVNFVVTQGTAALSSASATTIGSGFATVTAQLTNQNSSVQVSACVAPNNVPCQTFTLFSTPPSMWALETVSGSLQFVPIGQVFQPLVMRVTDGSSAANPVLGVTVAFATTLARVSQNSNENELPVLLGSSQAQVVTAQNGLAFIVPSAGSVGPCDVFIAASAGVSIAQFQLESLAPIVPITIAPIAVPARPGNNPAPAMPHAHPFGAQPAPPQSVPELFAVPEAAPSNPPGNDSPEDAPPGDCSKSRADSASADLAPPCKKSNRAATEAPPKIVDAKVEIEFAPAPSSDSDEVQPPLASASWQPADKRSCRVLAGDGLLP